MAIQINEISEKYINKLEKSYFNTVKLPEAVLSIKMAVEETAEAAKEEIKGAIQPLKDKIAQKDEFISSQIKINKTLQKKLDSYKPIIKEAYKQNITQEIRDKKNGLASILSGLIRRHEELSKPKIEEKPVIAEPSKAEEKSAVLKTENTKKPEKIAQTKKPRQVKRPEVASTILKEIEAQRKNQKLDKERIEEAQRLIKYFLEDAPQKDSYSSVQEHFKKTMDKYVRTVNSIVNGQYKFEEDKFGKIRVGKDKNGQTIVKQSGIDYNNNFHPYKYEIFNQDGSSMEIYDGRSDSYIAFRDAKGKEFIKIRYSDHYSIFISDKNGRLMVSAGIKDGVVEYMSVNFNDVKPIAEIESDEAMNVYAQNLISTARNCCKSQTKNYRDTTDIDYINPEGKITVHEYYVNRKSNPDPIFTYLYDTKDGQLEKLITNGDFGLHAKIVDDGHGGMKIIQYRTKGITGIDKRRKNSNLKDFRIGFYKSTENEHFEVQDLYDENYSGDKDRTLQREIYAKRNYGIASHPLTQSFTFYDLTKHQIKPWDLSILKPYL